jgi:ER-bound oxygenase mpaB/B'/Rubber oxygenase, catalytic domain
VSQQFVGRWSVESLEALRKLGDPHADGAVAEHFAGEGRSSSEVFRHLAFDGHPGTSGDDPLGRFLSDVPADPVWLDRRAVERAQDWFADVGSHVFCALYAGSLPTAYACHAGARVLGVTARLETDTKRRLNETAQFLLDVMRPKGLDAGAEGFQAVRRIRLMHSGVRWLVAHDSRVSWDIERLGVPINQEDLLLTLLTFTEVVFEVFDSTGVGYSDSQAADYLHLWSYIGHLIGVPADHLPLDRPDSMDLMRHVREVHFGPSRDARELTEALLDQSRAVLPPGLRGMPASAVRWYIGDAAADLIGVPKPDWTRVMFGPMAALAKAMSAERAHRGFLKGFSERFGRAMLTLAVDAERGGTRAQFSVPEELAGPLGVRRRTRAGRVS